MRTLKDELCVLIRSGASNEELRSKCASMNLRFREREGELLISNGKDFMKKDEWAAQHETKALQDFNRVFRKVSFLGLNPSERVDAKHILSDYAESILTPENIRKYLENDECDEEGKLLYPTLRYFQFFFANFPELDVAKIYDNVENPWDLDFELTR